MRGDCFYCAASAEYERLQQERVAAFKEFISDVETRAYPAPQLVAPITDTEFARFEASINA